MGKFSGIATEEAIRVFVTEIKKQLEATKDKPDAVSALKRLGRFTLNQFDREIPKWAKEYKSLFNEFDDQATSQLLNMSVDNFFSCERLKELGASGHTITRVRNLVRKMQVRDPGHRFSNDSPNEQLDIKNMREFLSRYDNRYSFAQAPNCGSKSADVIVSAIRSAGLPFKD